jgi:hypothetical protein
VPDDNKITENAQGPKKVTGDQGSVEQHSIKDQIDADRYEKANEAAKGPGIRNRKFRHRGTVW